jgi:ABC-2 type transport system ATP-binding protein
MADRIGVMCGGRLVAEGTLEDLRRQAGAGHATLEDTFLVLTETGSGQTHSGRGPIAA